jgi:hypothetical protein
MLRNCIFWAGLSRAMTTINRRFGNRLEPLSSSFRGRAASRPPTRRRVGCRYEVGLYVPVPGARRYSPLGSGVKSRRFRGLERRLVSACDGTFRGRRFWHPDPAALLVLFVCIWLFVGWSQRRRLRWIALCTIRVLLDVCCGWMYTSEREIGELAFVRVSGRDCQSCREWPSGGLGLCDDQRGLHFLHLRNAPAVLSQAA